MNLRIKNISAEYCGPVKKINVEPGSLTLFYGRNEDGKSFLVEFIIRCLFRNVKSWGYLRNSGTGKVTLTGIKDKPVDFKPGAGAKLENYIEEDPRGLPLTLLNLLVVKEGETGISDDKGGFTKDVVRTLLSSRRMLDEIDENIPKTVQQASIDTIINISRRGAGENYYNKLEEIQKIDVIISSLNNQSSHWQIKDLKLKENVLKQKKELLYRARKFKAFTLSSGIKKIEEQLEKIPYETISGLREFINEYRNLQEKIKSLKEELEDIQEETVRIPVLETKKEFLLKAKRYQAYLIAGELKTIEEKLRSLPEEEINRLENNITLYNTRKNELESCKNSIKHASEKSVDYHWLKAAKENYQKFFATGSGKNINKILPVTAVLAFTSGIAALLLNQKILGLIILIISAITALYYYSRLKKSVSSTAQQEELQQIKREFLRRFGEELDNITKLESILYEQEKYLAQLEVHNNQLMRLSAETDSYHKSIQDIFERFGFSKLPEDKWTESISGIRKRREEFISKRNQLKLKLAALNTDETEYEKEDPEIKFDRNEFEQTNEELTRLSEQKRHENKIISELREQESILKEKYESVSKTFRNLTGEEIPEEEWSGRLNSLFNKYNELTTLLESLKGQLLGLGVAEQDFEKVDPGVEYSAEEMEKTEKEQQQISEAIKIEEEKLTAFKAEIRAVTGADASAGWNDLVDSLYRKKEQLKKEFEETRAEIISGRLLHETIQELQLEEDQKLIEALNSEEVSSVLNSLTGHYNSLSFDDKGIITSDGFNDYYLEDLSTGAREQVMIALRIGILKRLLKNDTAFLILDDAFQHSDYEKRIMLVKTVCGLARKGWQIMYFTMDDHILNLFRKEKTGDYKEINLHELNPSLF